MASPDAQRSPFRYFRTSRGIIRLAVMLYARFPLSLRTSRASYKTVRAAALAEWRGLLAA